MKQLIKWWADFKAETPKRWKKVVWVAGIAVAVGTGIKAEFTDETPKLIKDSATYMIVLGTVIGTIAQSKSISYPVEPEKKD